MNQEWLDSLKKYFNENSNKFTLGFLIPLVFAGFILYSYSIGKYNYSSIFLLIALALSSFGRVVMFHRRELLDNLHFTQEDDLVKYSNKVIFYYNVSYLILLALFFYTFYTSIDKQI